MDRAKLFEKIKHGMLSSPQIRLLLENGYLATGYSLDCLRAATLDMRISGPVIQHVNGEPVEYQLCERDNDNLKRKKSITLERNSLTYVTTHERFNLPKDFIARFNLKSKWVHRGLLLGTGPIVDPEINDRLLIPIHNFSSQPVVIRNMAKLISVEFTRTLAADATYTLDDGKTCSYVENRSKDYNFHKYVERNGGDLPESSVDVTLRENKEDLKKAEAQYARIQNLGIIAGFALLVGIAALVFTTWGIISDANKNVSDAVAIIKKTETTDHDLKGFATENELSRLSEKLDVLENSISNLMYTPNASKESVFNNLNSQIETLRTKVKSLSAEIESLKKRQKDVDNAN